MNKFNRSNFKDGGSSEYHTTKEGKKAKKGLWYNIHQKRKVKKLKLLNHQLLK